MDFRILGATCKRCGEPFRYVRRSGPGRARLHCEVCLFLERIDANQFHYVNVTKPNRAKAQGKIKCSTG